MRKSTIVLLIFVIVFGGGLLTVQLFLHSSVKSIVASNSEKRKLKVQDKIQNEQDSAPKPGKRHEVKPPHHVEKSNVNNDRPSNHNQVKHNNNFVVLNSQDPFYENNTDESDKTSKSTLIIPTQEEDWFPHITEKISDESKKDRWSEPALLKNYVAKRNDRACGNLPSNVTITQRDDIILGEVSITRMPKWRQQQLRGTKNSSSSSQCSYAFVLMVSNHKYVDGALVMAETLWRTSTKVKKGEICLVMLTSEKLHPDSIRQLSLVFDVVKAMRTLGTFVPKSYYAPTFDKAYLWSLTEYKHIMFLDADHYVTEADQIESLLVSAGSASITKKKNYNKSKKHPKDHNNNSSNNNNTVVNDNDDDDQDSSVPANRIVAVGDHEYFQTGLMILKPNMNIFVDLYLEFRYGTFGYNQWRARDGILIRNCFLKSNEGIGHPGGIFHFYGFFKPWFDFRKSRKITKEPIQFDGMYAKWWNVYEDLHLQLFRFMPVTGSSLYGGGRKNRKPFLRDQSKRKFHCHRQHDEDSNNDDMNSKKDKKESVLIDPDCFVWLQRHRDNEEYVQPLSFVKARWWNLRVPSLKIVVSSISGTKPVLEATASNNNNNNNNNKEKKSDCNSICKGRNLVCRDDAFQWSTLSNCDALSKLLANRAFSFDDGQHSKNVSYSGFSCKSCSLKIDGTTLPHVNLQTQECSIHSFFAQKFQPRCDAELNGQHELDSLVRICPCVKKADQNVSGVVVNMV